MKEAIEELAREQARSQARGRMREKLGIPDDTLENAFKAMIDSHEHANDMIVKIKKLAKQMLGESRIKVSPYAKFDKYHKKKRK